MGAVSLVCADEHKELCAIESLIQTEIKREYLDGYHPVNDLPPSLPLRTRKARKPKKPKSHAGQGGASAGDDTARKNRNHGRPARTNRSSNGGSGRAQSS